MIRSGPHRPLLALSLGLVLAGCSQPAAEPRCGDSNLDTGEECDDGTSPGDLETGACSAQCTWRQYEADVSTGDASRPHVAMNGRGDYALTWHADGNDGLDVYVAAWTASGEPMLLPTRVNEATVGDQLQPRVGIAGNGRIVVVWASADPADDNVKLRAYAADGAPQDVLQLNSWTDGAQSEPAVAINEAGELVASWTSDGQDSDLTGVFAQRGDADGLMASAEPFLVNTEIENMQENPRLDLADDGRFVIAWKAVGVEPG